MPLAFQSLDRGTVAFGYFNIDSDLLLLRRHFFFTDAFVGLVSATAGAPADRPFEATLDGWSVPPERVGNVMGAIHGYDRSGFIGAVYDRFEFPSLPEDFHQRAAGAANRTEIEAILAQWAEPTAHDVVVEPVAAQVRLAGTTFDGAGFRDLVAYVWRGGYPRWLDEVRPPEVRRMREAIEASDHPLFAGQRWDITV